MRMKGLQQNGSEREETETAENSRLGFFVMLDSAEPFRRIRKICGE